MNTKVIFVAIVVGLVLVGTSIAFANPSSWVPPEKGFPDLGGMHPPLDEGGNPQGRAGTIDFSASTAKATMLFGANQGININTSFGANGLFNLFFGDLKIANLGNGLVFPDGTKQATASTGMFSLGKICNVLGSGWSNNIVAPDSWTASNRSAFATDAKGANYQIGCALSNGTSFGAAGGGIPSPNCGWNSACASSGLYYPSAPTNGCLTPQKVIASSNQASVTSGVASVSFTPVKTTAVGGYPRCLYDLSCGESLTSCSVPTTAYASSLSCGEFIYDNNIDDNGTSCGSGKVYQVYCR